MAPRVARENAAATTRLVAVRFMENLSFRRSIVKSWNMNSLGSTDTVVKHEYLARVEAELRDAGGKVRRERAEVIGERGRLGRVDRIERDRAIAEDHVAGDAPSAGPDPRRGDPSGRVQPALVDHGHADALGPG
jgi:hypothetical protein